MSTSLVNNNARVGNRGAMTPYQSKIYSEGRTGTCWTCDRAASFGTDDATGKPIAWCVVKNCIVAPERGCEYYHAVEPQ
jgi:hypothetical protein